MLEVGLMLLVHEYLLLSEILRLAESLGVEDGAGAELKGLEALVGVSDVLSAEHHSVVLHDHGLVLRVLLELGGDALAEGLAARHVILGEADRAADVTRLRDDAGVRNLMDDAECHESRRMGVDDSLHLGADLVDRLVERILGGRAVRADDGAVRLDAHDVLRGEGTLVDAGRGDPHVTVVVHYGQVSAGGRSETFAVDASDDQRKLLGRMHQVCVKLFHIST